MSDIKISDPPTSPSLISLNGFCGRKAQCFLSFFEGVPFVEFIYFVFTRMPGGVTVGDSGLLLCPLSVERY